MDCIQKTYFFTCFTQTALYTTMPLIHLSLTICALHWVWAHIITKLCRHFPTVFFVPQDNLLLPMAKCWHFFKILSSSYHTSHMSLRYLVKPSCSKVDLVSKCSDQIHIFKYSYHIFLEQFMLHILNYMVRALHLLQLTMFWPICVTMNIQNDLFWFKCRHGYVCATGRTMALSIMLCSTPSHTSIRRCLKSSTSCTFV